MYEAERGSRFIIKMRRLIIAVTFLTGAAPHHVRTSPPGVGVITFRSFVSQINPKKTSVDFFWGKKYRNHRWRNRNGWRMGGDGGVVDTRNVVSVPHTSITVFMKSKRFVSVKDPGFPLVVRSQALSGNYKVYVISGCYFWHKQTWNRPCCVHVCARRVRQRRANSIKSS